MDTNNWKWFKYTDLFGISGSKTTSIEDLETYGKGEYPYVTTQAVNNGVENFYNYSTEKGGVLTIDSAVLGFCSYQEKDFSASDHVEVLTPKFKMTKYIALFLTTIINREQYRYSYGRKCSHIKLRRSHIKLPVTPEGTPDWQYMETFIKDRILPQLPKKAQKVWLQKYDTKPQNQKEMKLNTDDWKWFYLKDLFSVKRGERLTIPNREEGDRPLVTAGEENTGVAGHISNNVDIYKDAITIDMFGYTCYRGYQFSCDDNILVLTNKNINEYNGTFIAAIINRDKYKFAYGRQYRQKNFIVHKIKLPVTPTGEPDWQFMEDYIKSLPYSKNLEPSKPDEKVDELMEVKKELIKLQQVVQAKQTPQYTVHIDTYNDNSKTINVEK